MAETTQSFSTTFDNEIDQYVAKVRSHTIAAGIFEYETISADYAIKVVEKVAQVARSAIKYAESLVEVAETQKAIDNIIQDTISSIKTSLQEIEDNSKLELDNSPEGLAKRAKRYAQDPANSSDGRNEVYQGLILRDVDNVEALISQQPNLVAEISPKWKADILYDFIHGREDSDRIIWLFEIFGVDAVKELLQDPEYDFLISLFSTEYVKVLKRLRQMGVLGVLEKTELKARVTDLAGVLEMVFDEE